MRPLVVLGYLLLGSGSLTLSAWAQVTDTAQVVLPDLAPREIEIRGTLEISFPSLQRQPLVGFNPPPLVPQVSPDRQPYIEPYSEAARLAGPVSLQRPVPPAIATIGSGRPARGLFEGALGRYVTRSFNGYLEQSFSNGLMPYGAVRYTGSNGFVPFADRPEIETPYDLLNVQAGLAYSGPVHAGLEVGGFAHTYRLYGLVETLPFDAPQREGTGAYAQLWLGPSAQDDVEGGLELRLSSSRYRTTYPEGFFSPAAETYRRLERRLDAQGQLALPLTAGTLHLDAQGHLAGIDPSGFLESDVWSLSGGASLALPLGSTLQLSIGGRVLVLEATPTHTRATYVSPVLAVDVSLTPRSRLYVRQQPHLIPYRLDELLREMPILDDSVLPQPALHTVDLEAGSEVFFRAVRLRAAGGFRASPFERYAVLSRRLVGTELRYLTQLGYAQQRRYYAQGEIAMTLPGSLQGSLRLTYQQVRLPEVDRPVPYEPSWRGQLLLAYPLPKQRGLVQLTGSYEGLRYADLSQTQRVSPYLDIDLQATYQLTPAIGFIGSLENLTPGTYRSRWLGYPEPHVLLSVGMRIRW
ncbi:hypothetical protein HRbin18_01939 [bacterium HR18]|nr:hypothetical protein HRbin18_01939 [bacterium HR18]